MSKAQKEQQDQEPYNSNISISLHERIDSLELLRWKERESEARNNRLEAKLKRALAQLLHPFPLIICVLLLFATAPLPYGYYQFLRIAVTIWGLISVYKAIKHEQSAKAHSIALLLSGAIAILYNPVLPIHLDKATWTIINLLTIPAILICTYILNNPKPTLNQP